jgi:natural product precursor
MKKITLSNLHHQEVESNQLSKITGGGQVGNCGCGCNGPSSTCDNGHANFDKGLHSPGTEPGVCGILNTWDSFVHLHAWECK